MSDGSIALALLRFSAAPGKGGWLYEKVATVLAVHGHDATLGWLRGYWYASGNRDAGNHGRVTTIIRLFGIDSIADLGA